MEVSTRLIVFVNPVQRVTTTCKTGANSRGPRHVAEDEYVLGSCANSRAPTCANGTRMREKNTTDGGTSFAIVTMVISDFYSEVLQLRITVPSNEHDEADLLIAR